MVDPNFTINDVWQDIAKRYNLKLTGKEDYSLIQTTAEFARRYGISEYKALNIIKHEVAQKRARITEKAIECFGGAIKTVQAYDFTQEKTDD